MTHAPAASLTTGRCAAPGVRPWGRGRDVLGRDRTAAPRRGRRAGDRAGRHAVRRPAVDVRAHPLRRVEAARPLGLRHDRRVLDDRLPGGRAEPLATVEDGHLDPGQRAGSRLDRRSRRSTPIPGSTSSSRAPGSPRTTRSTILREFLLRGGTMTFDDFHGPIEWANLERQMKRIFPNRTIVDLPPDAPDLQLLLPDRRVPADARARVVPAGPHVGEGRLRRAPARHRGRRRPRDGAHQLEHRHGRWLGVVERGRIPRVRPLHRAGVPHADQRNRLLADALITFTDRSTST